LHLAKTTDEPEVLKGFLVLSLLMFPVGSEQGWLALIRLHILRLTKNFEATDGDLVELFYYLILEIFQSRIFDLL